MRETFFFCGFRRRRQDTVVGIRPVGRQSALPPWCAALGALRQRGLVLFYIRPRVAVCESFCFYRALVGGWVVVGVRWARFLARGKLAHVTCSFLKVRSVTGTTTRLGVTDKVLCNANTLHQPHLLRLFSSCQLRPSSHLFGSATQYKPRHCVRLHLLVPDSYVRIRRSSSVRD